MFFNKGDQMTATFEDIKAQAISEAWSNRKIKDALFATGMNDRRAELVEAVRAVHPAVVVTQAALAEPVKPVAIAPVVTEATTPVAEPMKLADGCTIFCDAAANKVKKVINAYGRQRTYDNGGMRIGIKSGEFEAAFYNTQCYHPKSGALDSFAGECFAVLKAVEVAVQHGLKNVTISNDRIGGFVEQSGKKTQSKGFTYLFVAKKMADENNLTVTFDVCTGDENQADRISRIEA